MLESVTQGNQRKSLFPLQPEDPFGASLMKTAFCMNRRRVAKKRGFPEGQSLMVGIWSTNRKLARNRAREIGAQRALLTPHFL